ncbi:hypothetical protein GCK32_001339 [Trichostrongylus colubriformis]|uniref:Uncharacterized protein n=1 Tax=Trichostrongylus colubriformis TaxID=6319 RepID=A0AAN8EXL5_TRICO
MGALVSAVRGDPVDQDTIDAQQLKPVEVEPEQLAQIQYSGERVVRPDEKSPIRDYLTHEALVYFTPAKERKARDQFAYDARKKVTETTEKTTETVIEDGKMNVLETKEVKKTVVITTEQLEEQSPKHKAIQGVAESEEAQETSPAMVLPSQPEKVSEQEHPGVKRELSAKDEEREGLPRKIAPTDDKKGEPEAEKKEEPIEVIALEERRKREKVEAPPATPPVSILPKEYRMEKVSAPADEGVATAREKSVREEKAVSKAEKAARAEKMVGTPRLEEPPIELISPEEAKPKKKAETPVRTPSRSPERHHSLEGGIAGTEHEEPPRASTTAKEAMKKSPAVDEGVTTAREKAIHDRSEEERAPSHEAKEIEAELYKDYPVELIVPEEHEPHKKAETPLMTPTRSPVEGGATGTMHKELTASTAPALANDYVKGKDVEKTQERSLESAPEKPESTSAQVPSRLTAVESTPQARAGLGGGESAPMSGGSHQKLGEIAQEFPGREVKAVPDRKVKLTEKSNYAEKLMQSGSEEKILKPITKPKREASIMKPPSAPKKEGSIMRSPSVPKREGSIMKPISAPRNEGSIMRSPSAPKREGSIMKHPSAPRNEGSIMRSPSAPKREGSITKPPTDRKTEGPFVAAHPKSSSGGLAAKSSPKPKSKGSPATRHTKSKSGESITKPLSVAGKEGSTTRAPIEPKKQSSLIKPLPENKEGRKPASKSGEEGRRAAAGRLVTPPSESTRECLETTNEPQKEGAIYTSTVVEKKSTTMKSVEEGSPTLHTAKTNEDHSSETSLKQNTNNTATETSVQQEKHSTITKSPTQSTHVMVDVERVNEKKHTITTTTTDVTTAREPVEEGRDRNE